MKSVLDTLLLRRPKLNYVCPPICEANFSSSAGPVIVLEPIGKRKAPSGFIISGSGHNFHLAWDTYPGALCYTVYKAVDELNPFGDYIVVAECVQDNFFDGDEGYYRVSVITSDGESELSDPINVGVNPAPPVNTIDLIQLDNFNDLTSNGIVPGDVGVAAAYYFSGGVTVIGSPQGSAYCANASFHFGYDINILFVSDQAYWKGPSVLQPIGDGTLGAYIPVRMNTSGLTACLGGVYDPAAPSFTFWGISGGTGVAINDAGECAIWSNFNRKVYRWVSGVGTDVTPLTIDPLTIPLAIDINSLGHLIGSFTTGGILHSFLNKTGGSINSIDMGELSPGKAVGAQAMNSSTVVVGGARDISNNLVPFKWTESGGFTALPLLPLTFSGQANDINDGGLIVGDMEGKAFVNIAGLTHSLMDFVPLGSGWDSLESAKYINNSNQIVGRGTYLGTPNKIYILKLG